MPPVAPIAQEPVIAERLIVEKPIVITPPVDIVAVDTGVEIVEEERPLIPPSVGVREPAVMPRSPVKSVGLSNLAPIMFGLAALFLDWRKAKR